jgi:hypothetical protein
MNAAGMDTIRIFPVTCAAVTLLTNIVKCVNGGENEAISSQLAYTILKRLFEKLKVKPRRQKKGYLKTVGICPILE